MDPIISAAAFIKRHWDVSRYWDRAQLVPWLRWFSARGYVAVTHGQNGRISGIGMARPAKSAQTAKDEPYHYDENGNSVFMDLLISTNPAAMLSLWRMLKRRFGVRQFVALQRSKYNGRLIVHDMKKYDIKMEGSLNGRI